MKLLPFIVCCCALAACFFTNDSHAAAYNKDVHHKETQSGEPRCTAAAKYLFSPEKILNATTKASLLLSELPPEDECVNFLEAFFSAVQTNAPCNGCNESQYSIMMYLALAAFLRPNMMSSEPPSPQAVPEMTKEASFSSLSSNKIRHTTTLNQSPANFSPNLLTHASLPTPDTETPVESVLVDIVPAPKPNALLARSQLNRPQHSRQKSAHF